MSKTLSFKILLRENIVIVALIFLVVLMTALSRSFLTAPNLINIFTQISIYGIVACAMTFAIICGEFDLSVGSLIAVTTIVFIDTAKNYGFVVAVVMTLAIGILVGSINGFLVAKVKISAFVATLSSMVSLKGLALFYTNGKPINYVHDGMYNLGNGSFLGIPFIVYMFLTLVVIGHLVLKYTKFGRNIFATGGNMTVAAMAGINVVYYKFIVFVILGAVTAFAGIIMACRLNSGNSLFGNDLALSVVAATVIGGTSLSGGKGSVVKTLFGMLVLGVLFNALLILGVQANWQDVIKGLILIAVVSFDAYFSKPA